MMKGTVLCLTLILVIVFPFNLVRFYVGLEDAEVLIEDIKQGLKRIQ